MKKYKILFLDVNFRFYTPTRNLVPICIKKACETFFFGPGYLDRDAIRLGIKHFLHKNGPFDFVFATDAIVFHERNKGITSTNSLPSRNIELDDAENIFVDYKSIDEKKVTFLTKVDYYSLNNDDISRLDSTNSYYATFDSTMAPSILKLKNLDKEKFSRMASDAYHDFSLINKKKIIPFPHFVSCSEFYFSKLENRNNIWSVPGVPYYYRKNAKATLKSLGYKDKSGNLRLFFSLLKKIGIKSYASPIVQSIYQSTYRRAIEDTMFCYSCGSALEYPLRKFFEIPAMGALLINMPFQCQSNLGFIDWENHIQASPEDLPEISDYLLKNTKEAQRIANQGQDLIWNKHSCSSRSGQMSRALDKISKGSFKGAAWDHGEFYCL